jgi:SHS2 domain-containing protein
MKYKYLEHTADLKFQAEGKNLKHAFKNAAKAMFNSIVDLSQIVPKIEKSIEISSESIESLLFDWLSELLRIHDTDDLLFSEFTIQSIRRQFPGWYLKAKIKGEKLDLKKHDPETQIKAMTYNELKVEKKSNKFVLTVVMDI